LRRGGLRVVYLGQSVELESLMETAQAARPECVVLSAAQRAQAAALAEVGRRLDGLGWRPAFFFGGQAFMREPELVAGIAGEYLGGAASVAADEIRRRLAS
jgi:methanogenic corrinoid protein MtbC1